jgi:sugar phosphate isomerase/epimerase
VLDHPDIGISTGAYAELPLAAALARIAELAPAAEIFSYGSHSLLKPGNALAAATSGLPFSVHGPFTHFEFATTSGSKHRAAVDLHRRHMEAAAELGAFLYIVHPDLHRRPRAWNAKVVAALERSFEELRVLQDELGLAVAVENMPLTRHSHFTAPGDLDLRGLGLVLDTGHAALTGTLAEWLDDPQARLRHVHLHDNGGRGDGDRHQPVGSGVVDAGPVLAAARAVGATIALELTNEADVIASLEYLRAHDLLSLRVR